MSHPAPSDRLATPNHVRTRKGEPIHLIETFCRDAGPGDYQDDECPALHFYVGPTGIKTFGGYKWSPDDGKALRKSFGRWTPNAERVKTARSEVKAWAEAVRTGAVSNKAKEAKDKAEAAEAERRISVKAVLKQFEHDRRAKGKRNPDWAEEVVNYHCSEWIALPFVSITKAMLLAKSRELRNGDATKGVRPRGPQSAGILIKAMRALYAFAIKEEIYDGHNIAKKVDLPSESVRTRVLTAAEKAALVEALDRPHWPGYVKPLFRFLMLTGARKTNALTARFDEMDLDSGLWRIPAEKSKAGHLMEVILRPEAVEIIKAQREKHPESAWMFPSDYLHDQPVKDVWHIWRKLLSAAGVSGVTIHDLRRTYGSDLINNHVSLNVVAKAMGHRNVATTAKHYAHVNASTVREALMGVSA